MALGATIYVFDIRLADSDRDVYETLNLRLARHPSESGEFLVTRLLAYCLEYREGLTFSKGLSSPDEPALAVRDLTGALQAWIEVGAPEAARLHKASKLADRVVVYTHRDAAQFAAKLAGERIHRADRLEIHAIDRELIDGCVERLQRRLTLDVSIAARHLYVGIGTDTVAGPVEPVTIPAT